MVDLNKLSKPALAAAMKGGTDGWGKQASIDANVVYAEPAHPTMRRRKCHCGCGKRVTHSLMANGLCMGGGCEFSTLRRVKELNG